MAGWIGPDRVTAYCEAHQQHRVARYAVADKHCDICLVGRLKTENAKLRSLLREWVQPGDCGCDTASCMGTCLAARSLDSF